MLQIFLFFILMIIVICCIYSDIVYETFESKSHDENLSQYSHNQSKQQPQHQTQIQNKSHHQSQQNKSHHQSQQNKSQQQSQQQSKNTHYHPAFKQDNPNCKPPDACCPEMADKSSITCNKFDFNNEAFFYDKQMIFIPSTSNTSNQSSFSPTDQQVDVSGLQLEHSMPSNERAGDYIYFNDNSFNHICDDSIHAFNLNLNNIQKNKINPSSQKYSQLMTNLNTQQTTINNELQNNHASITDTFQKNKNKAESIYNKYCSNSQNENERETELCSILKSFNSSS